MAGILCRTVPLAALLAAITTSAAAQAPYQLAFPRKVQLMLRNNSPEGLQYLGGARAFAVGDVDGDRSLDLVMTGGASFESLRLNDGAGRFVDGQHVYLTKNSSAYANVVLLGDIDGDGRLDAFLGGMPYLLHAGGNRLFRNNGNTVFVEVTATDLPPDADKTADAVFADIDNDGDLDLVIANGRDVAQQDRVYRNNGRGVFTDVTATSLPAGTDASTAIVAGDLDGDRDIDLVIAATTNVPAKLLLNNGSGVFAGAAFAHLAAEHVNDLELVDIDRDGDLDLVAATGLPTVLQQTRLLLNNGSGGFSDVTQAQLPGILGECLGVASGDIDGDGDRDLVFDVSGVARVCRNDGTGTFSDASATLLPPYVVLMPSRSNLQSDDVVLADVDSDGDLDILTPDALLMNDGRGTFANASSTGGLPFGRAFDTVNRAGSLLVDVNNDGELDLITSARSLLTAVAGGLWLGGGPRGFRDVTATHLPATGTGWLIPAAADIDRDGDQDLVFGSFVGPVLLRNGGAGVFTDISASLPPTRAEVRAVIFADVDGDGDGDLVLAVAGQNRLLVNNGTGTFTDVTAAQLPVDADPSNSCIAIDVDRDRDLDLVFANGNPFATAGAQNRLYRNNGSGTFVDATATSLPVEANRSAQVVAADLDGDGDLDFLSNDASSVFPDKVRMYLNNGTGTFVEASTGRLTSGSPASIVAADFDGDGDVDIYASSGASFSTELLLNDGSARFQNVPLGEALMFSTACTGDIDGDGDIDVIAGTDILVNRQRHLHTPYVAQATRPFTVEIFARPGSAPGTDLALPMLDFALLAAPLPLPGLGSLWLTGAALFGPVQAIPAQSGRLTMRFTIPGIPALHGQTMAWQALLLEGGTSLRLTNARADVLGF